jgi:hypothetical protein
MSPKDGLDFHIVGLVFRRVGNVILGIPIVDLTTSVGTLLYLQLYNCHSFSDDRIYLMVNLVKPNSCLRSNICSVSSSGFCL